MRKSTKYLSLLVALLMLASTTAFAEGDGVIHRQNFGSPNLLELPLVKEGDDPVTIVIWSAFNSTVMEELDECLVYQELERRTGVHTDFVYPPVGQEKENYNMRLAAGDLPHIFIRPHENTYPGGLDKAVEDEVFVALNDYYDRGLTPNYKYLRDTYPQIAKDTVLDSGLMVAWCMFDYVPSSPWSGLWVRQDWLEEQNLDVPVTIDDWTNMLRVFKENYGAVLGNNIKDWYGVATNQQFAASFDAGYQWLNQDGTAVFGPSLDEYKNYLANMNEWYDEGLMDTDFATRSDADYQANAANGVYGAFGFAYGEVGPAKVTGEVKDPDYKLLAVRMPTSYEGQVTHTRQHDSIVRTAKEFVTMRAVDEGIDDIVMQWMDYKYSQEGGDLCSYGVEGVSYKWDENDELVWMYEESGLVDKYISGEVRPDFWTLYPLFKMHEGSYLRDSTSYEMQPEVWQCIAEWMKDDASWFMPDGISQTADEAVELAAIMTNINTYREEMTYKFISGQESLDAFEDFQESLKGMDLERATEIKQAALDRYLAR